MRQTKCQKIQLRSRERSGTWNTSNTANATQCQQKLQKELDEFKK